MSVSITFDDGLLDHYENAFPLMGKYHMEGTVFVIEGLIGGEWENQPCMSLTHIREMRREGWEVGCHTSTHIPLNTEPIDVERFPQLKWHVERFGLEGMYGERIVTPPRRGVFFKEIVASKLRLLKLGLGPIVSFAYPYGVVPSPLTLPLQMVKLSYRYARGYRESNLNPVRPGLTVACAGRADGTRSILYMVDAWDDIPTWVEKAKLNDLWLVIVYHAINNQGRGWHPVTVEKFEQHLRCVKKSGLRVEPLGRHLGVIPWFRS